MQSRVFSFEKIQALSPQQVIEPQRQTAVKPASASSLTPLKRINEGTEEEPVIDPSLTKTTGEREGIHAYEPEHDKTK